MTTKLKVSDRLMNRTGATTVLSLLEGDSVLPAVSPRHENRVRHPRTGYLIGLKHDAPCIDDSFGNGSQGAGLLLPYQIVQRLTPALPVLRF